VKKSCHQSGLPMKKLCIHSGVEVKAAALERGGKYEIQGEETVTQSGIGLGIQYSIGFYDTPNTDGYQ
jgi:hypothetical protein